MERMPLPCAMALALDAFKKFSHLRGEFRRTASSTSRHSFHVRMIVRKAILNEPKPFAYFWASKVTEGSVSLSSFVGLVNLGSKSKEGLL
ncbi:hypothetical protein [Sphingobacterium sp.]|uniref:hypothetical protein n=1 Tax=Sphingobacterium sp. TaxID=341027 RepID=UPI0028AA440D|nr:hypothetical protein [Sphingobacterium sp.]